MWRVYVKCPLKDFPRLRAIRFTDPQETQKSPAKPVERLPTPLALPPTSPRVRAIIQPITKAPLRDRLGPANQTSKRPIAPPLPSRPPQRDFDRARTYREYRERREQKILKDLRDLVSRSKNRINSLQRALDETRHDLGVMTSAIEALEKCRSA